MFLVCYVTKLQTNKTCTPAFGCRVSRILRHGDMFWVLTALDFADSCERLLFPCSHLSPETMGSYY